MSARACVSLLLLYLEDWWLLLATWFPLPLCKFLGLSGLKGHWYGCVSTCRLGALNQLFISISTASSLKFEEGVAIHLAIQPGSWVMQHARKWEILWLQTEVVYWVFMMSFPRFSLSSTSIEEKGCLFLMSLPLSSSSIMDTRGHVRQVWTCIIPYACNVHILMNYTVFYTARLCYKVQPCGEANSLMSAWH